MYYSSYYTRITIFCFCQRNDLCHLSKSDSHLVSLHFNWDVKCFFPQLKIVFLLSFLTVRPSKPRCYTEGSTEEGKDFSLRCTSSEGTNPMKYIWDRTTETKILPASAMMGNGPFNKLSPTNSKQFYLLLNSPIFPVMCFTFPPDSDQGILRVKNASTSVTGTYRCTAKNRVGTEECFLQVKVTAREYLTSFGLTDLLLTCFTLLFKKRSFSQSRYLRLTKDIKLMTLKTMWMQWVSVLKSCVNMLFFWKILFLLG